MLYQREPPKFLGDMKGVAHWSFPGNRLPLFRRTLRTKQIRAKYSACDGRARIQGSEGDSHRAVPYLRLGIDARRDLKPGVPCPSGCVIWKIEIDIKVGPLLLR